MVYDLGYQTYIKIRGGSIKNDKRQEWHKPADFGCYRDTLTSARIHAALFFFCNETIGFSGTSLYKALSSA